MNILCSTFKLFGLPYFIYLMLSIGVIVGLVFLLKKFSGKARKYVGITLVSLGVLFVFLDMLDRMLYYQGEGIGNNLPLNFYHMAIYFCIAIQLTHKESLIKFGYLVILPVSLYSLIIVPDFYCQLAPFSLGVLAFYAINIIAVLYSILHLIWGDMYLYKKDIISSFITYVIVIASVHIFNVFMRFSTWGLTADYCGTVGDNYDVLTKAVAGILPADYGAFIVVIPMLLYVLGMGFLMVIPFDSVRNKKDKQLQQEQLIALGNFKVQQNSNKRGGSQVLVRSEEKARPAVEKNVSQSSPNGGFVSVNKEIKVNKDKE